MEIQGWVATLGERLAPTTVSSCLSILRMPLDAAVRDGKLRANPALGVALPRRTRRLLTPDRVLTGKELGRLVDGLPDRWQAMIFTAGWLGLRWSEAVGLRRMDFNPLRSHLYVGNVVVVEVEGRNIIREGGKTDAAARLLSVPAAVASRLGDHIDRYQMPSDGFLFVTETGSLPLRTNFNRRVFAPAVQAARLDGRGITLRQLRHTGASLMLDAGMALQDVSQRMGHAQPSTTFDRYSHLLTARQEAGTAALDAAIRSISRS